MSNFKINIKELVNNIQSSKFSTNSLLSFDVPTIENCWYRFFFKICASENLSLEYVELWINKRKSRIIARDNSSDNSSLIVNDTNISDSVQAWIIGHESQVIKEYFKYD